ncbi:DUF134 domain-containing protein [Candidatus Woesearchaeota archaeon]|nr:DUF134 domain-containing protein [Candidatus Woesearchaeota archaeon]
MRPRRCRRIGHGPRCNSFGPHRIITKDEVNLTIEELEAIRLKDVEELDQIKAAEKMNVSQPTFHRILNDARKKIADALVNAKQIRIYGGANKMSERKFKCYKCENEFEVPYGTPRPDKCGKCGSTDIHRADNQGRGLGKGACGRRRGQV